MGKSLKFSYSKLNTYHNCGWRYKLQYNDGHFINSDSLASDFGVLVHHFEELIATNLKEGNPIDYFKLKNDFLNINIPKTSPRDTEGGIYGVNVLRDKYGSEFIEKDDSGASYESRAQEYLSTGMYRIEKFLKDHPTLKILAAEKYFSISLKGATFSGFIDRIYYEESTGKYFIDDIKTKIKPFKEKDLATPLQFVIYTVAIMSIYNVTEDKIICTYDLPFLNLRQEGGTKGYVKRGVKMIESLSAHIGEGDFRPKPSPLCHYCPFSYTNPNQPEEGKHLCPYFSLWTPTNPTWEVNIPWDSIDKYELDLKLLEDKYGDMDINLDF